VTIVVNPIPEYDIIHVTVSDCVDIVEIAEMNYAFMSVFDNHMDKTFKVLYDIQNLTEIKANALNITDVSLFVLKNPAYGKAIIYGEGSGYMVKIVLKTLSAFSNVNFWKIFNGEEQAFDYLRSKYPDMPSNLYDLVQDRRCPTYA